MNNDPAHAVLTAAAAWLAQIVARNPEDFDVNSPGQGINVVIAAMDSEQPRIELYVAGRLMGHTQLVVVNPSAAN